MRNTTNPKSKLLRVYCAIRHTSRGTKYIYTGQFEDGMVRKIRESANCYVSVAQVRYPETYHYSNMEEFCFSSKPSVSLNKWQRNQDITTVQIGLDTAA